MSTATVNDRATASAVEKGVTAGTDTRPRPNLAGLRFFVPNDKHKVDKDKVDKGEVDKGKVYLIDPDGCRRWIPDPPTYERLFLDWLDIHAALKEIEEITRGEDFSTDAKLITVGGPVYLLTNKKKHEIAGKASMDKYHFGGKVVAVTKQEFDGFETGLPWH